MFEDIGSAHVNGVVVREDVRVFAEVVLGWRRETTGLSVHLVFARFLVMDSTVILRFQEATRIDAYAEVLARDYWAQMDIICTSVYRLLARSLAKEELRLRQCVIGRLAKSLA